MTLTTSRKSKWIGGLLILVATVCGLTQSASALSNLGPDPNEFVPQVASGTFAYGISSENHEFAAIPSTRVFLYFTNNTGNKSVVIIGGDVCTDTQNSALTGAGGNYWDRPYKPNPPTAPAVPAASWPGYAENASIFSVQATTVTTGYSTSNTCYKDEKTLTFPGSALTYDQKTGLYKVSLVATMWPTSDNAQNHFQLRLTETSGVIGYDAGLAENSVSILRYNRDPAQVTNGYADYLLPFAPDCTVNGSKAASAYWYDDDNDSASTQPEKFWMQLLKYRVSDGAYIGPVPLTFHDANGTPPGPTVMAGPVATSYYVTSGNKKSVRMDFTAESGYKYIWRWNHVFHRNVLQFRLPFDSIYYLTGCKAPGGTVTPHSNVDKDQITAGDTATFNHTATVTNYVQNATFAYSVYRTRNGVQVGGAQTGTKSFTGNGDYDLLTNAFTASAADLGTRICEYVTLSPSGSVAVNFTANPTTPVCTVVVKRPYFKAIGDVSAGVGMSLNGNECAAGGLPVNQNAGIVSWNTGAPNYNGAGAFFAALALNHMQGFASGQGSTYAPSGLSFANTGGGTGQIDAGQQLYGGKFNGGDCLGDFWKNASSVTSDPASPFYLYTGGAITNGTRKVLYYDGSLTITNNVTFSGSYASLADVPSFTIVVRGSIYVDKSVTQLDGFYISIPKNGLDDSGKFKTCAEFYWTPAGLDKNLQSKCDTALTINGAVVAKQAWLNRTAGTVNGSAAETFNYSPEFWITAPYGNGLTTPNFNGYDSITSLPPVL